MRDCPNAEIRDLLPELVHERLDAATRPVVIAHVDGCDACTDELALLRRLVLVRVAAPAIDVARVVAALPAPPAAAVARRGRSWSRWGGGVGLALAAGLAGVMVVHGPGRDSREPAQGPSAVVRAPSMAPVASAPSVGSSTGAVAPTPVPMHAPAASTRGELALAGSLEGVSDDGLAKLLADIEALDAVPSAEPETELPVARTGSEGMR